MISPAVKTKMASWSTYIAPVRWQDTSLVENICRCIKKPYYNNYSCKPLAPTWLVIHIHT